MHPNEMIARCACALQCLDEIEVLIQYIPPKLQAIVFRAKPDIIELQQIAQLETADRVTSEQVVHIHQLCGLLDMLHKKLPRNALDGLQEED